MFLPIVSAIADRIGTLERAGRCRIGCAPSSTTWPAGSPSGTTDSDAAECLRARAEAVMPTFGEWPA